jgi:hypothetical protein
MSPTIILTILQALLGAAPQILALFQQATAGTPVSEAQVDAVLNQYGVDRAALIAAIGVASAQTSPVPGSAKPTA